MSDAFTDIENPSLSKSSLGIGDSTRTVPDTLQDFLSQVGVVNVPVEPGNRVVSSSSTSTHVNPNESIFESYFDLTEERLRYVFDMFDTDEDGRISYESLKKGLRFHMAGFDTGAPGTFLLDDDASFQYLVRHIDLDNSGDVSFEEFSEGLRLLILRSLFKQPVLPIDDNSNSATINVIDYDAVRLEKRRVLPMRSDRETDETTEISAETFYFTRRPEWVKARWINVVTSHCNNDARTSAAMSMNRLAIKYLLHPLALEDALSPEAHRPKAELYSKHYFIMAPVFFIVWESVNSLEAETSSARRLRNWLSILPRLFQTNATSKENASTRSTTRISRIDSQMVSIFVNVPKDDTIITFTSGIANGDSKIDDKENFRADSSNRLWERVQRELEKSYSKLRQYDAQYLTYALLDEAVDLVDPILKAMREEIDHEKVVLVRDKFRNLSRIRSLKSQLERVGRRFKPFLRLLTHVIEDDAISPGATVYLRDVLDNLECSDEELRQLVSECEALDAEADKAQSRQMDVTLYTLTVVSTVFLPAQFLTGVWGMNFKHMPELDETWGYKMFWAISSFLAMTMVILLNFGRLR